MAEIFKFKQKKLSEKYKGATLCKNGHHKWLLDKNSKFDTKKGSLISVYKCTKCGQKKVKGAS
tara:strand:- start:7101 stop:7289 length:189 start_codon:yes stop_codon:yes gene_type:complete